MVTVQTPIEALLEEGRKFAPGEAFIRQANVKDRSVYEKAKQDLEGFWAEQAGQFVWFKKWDKVLKWESPWAQWFVGGELNITVNCIDRHLKTWRRNKAAFIWEGEPGEERVLTYADLYREVCKFANVLKRLGAKKGDRVALCLPMIPELPIAMLACARIGALHTIVFGGFSVESLRDRINDAQAKVLVTADGGWRRGNIVHLKRNADEAVSQCPSIEQVVVVHRGVMDATHVPLREGRDHWWHRLMEEAPLSLRA